MKSFGGKLGTECSFCELLRVVYMGKYTGELLVEREDQKKKIFLENGSIRYCATNINSERLGSVLLQQGKIDSAGLRRALQEKGSQRLGQKLVSDGLISDEELQSSLLQSSRDNVYGIFNWESGSFQFGPCRTELPHDLKFQLPTSDVILEGVRRVVDYSVVEQGLVSLSGSLTIAADAPEATQIDSLTPVEGFLLSRIDGTLSLEDICAISTVDREKTCRCLYGMYCAGLILGDARPPEVSDLFGVSGEEVSPAEQQSAQPVGQPAEKAGSRTQEQPPAPALHDEIENKYKTCCLAQVDLYTILEVQGDASEEQIRKSYYRLAKTFHPDRHRGKGDEDQDAKLEALFMRIGEAYDVLHDTNKRCDYDQTIFKNPGAAIGGSTSQPMPPDKVARMYFKDGMRFYQEKDYWNAVQLFRRTIDISPDENSEHYRYLALALSQNPKWGKESERCLLKAIELEPFSPDLRLMLGRLYRRSGMTHRAENQFQEALKLEPGNLTIQAELNDLQGGGESSGGTFIKGLFRKNRKDS